MWPADSCGPGGREGGRKIAVGEEKMDSERKVRGFMNRKVRFAYRHGILVSRSAFFLIARSHSCEKRAKEMDMQTRGNTRKHLYMNEREFEGWRERNDACVSLIL